MSSKSTSAVMGGEMREIALAREFVNESDAADNRSRLCETGLVNEAVPRFTLDLPQFRGKRFRASRYFIGTRAIDIHRPR